MRRPLITIITACFNSSQHIAQTLESVRVQTGVDCEHVLADGGSTDGTQRLIEAGLRRGGRWISEPDTGIADAMNKCIGLAQGEWLLFLQSDDYLCSPEVLGAAAKNFEPDLDICGFPVLFGSGGDAALMRPRGANAWLNFKTGLNHQGTFIRRSLFERIGRYDTSFRIAMDYEFFLRAYRTGASFCCHHEPVIAFMRDSGVSSQLDWSNLKRRLAEEKRIHYKLQTPALVPAYAAWWMLYPRYRQLRAALTGAT